MIVIVLMLLIVSELATGTIKRDWSGPYFPPDFITSRPNDGIEMMMMVSEECDNLSVSLIFIRFSENFLDLVLKCSKLIKI